MLNRWVIAQKPKRSGFTIVELLVVIVVIGILAAITITSYTGISAKANIATLQSDLMTASSQLKIDQVLNSGYPISLNAANGGNGLKHSPSVSYTYYSYDNNTNPQTFCLEALSDGVSYKITNDSAPVQGYCTPQVVMSGLVMYLDANNPSSYPGTGTTWTDLSGNGNNMTLYNGVGYNTTSGTGVLSFDGVDDYASIPSLNLSSGTSTVMAASRYSGATRGRMVNAANNNWLMGHWSNSTASFYAVGWVTSSGAGASDTTWRIYAATGNTTTDVWELYINGTLNISNSAGTQGPNGIAVGRYGASASEFSTGECSFVLVYNRVLTASEILQNFNEFKGRFGL